MHRSPDGPSPKARKTVPRVFPRGETLYVGGWDWAPPVTFNRLAPDPNWPVDGVVQIMYEALFGYDQLSGELVPHLARGIERRPGAIAVKLDARARWSDGMPVTVEDVIYTFLLDKRYPTPRHGMWKFLENVGSSKPGEIVFTLKKGNPNPLYVLDYLSENVILPKHIWSEIERKKGWNQAARKSDYMTLLTFKNDRNPVVSGPYRLISYSDQKIVLQRRDDYWGNAKYGARRAAPKYIIHPLLSTNTAYTDAMVKGHLDLAGHFIPRIWHKRTHQVRAWSTSPPYHRAGSIPALMLNHERPPFDDVNLRRALAHAVDFERINALALSSYSPRMRPGFILPFGAEAKYFSEEDATIHGYGFDIGKSREILLAAGYSFGNKGRLLHKNGEAMGRFEVKCPRGWSDWENAARVLVAGFGKIGVSAGERLVDYSIWKRDLSIGNFDMAIDTPTPMLWPSTPWRRFAQVMSSQNRLPVGQSVYENYGRYSDPQAEQMIRALPGIANESELVTAYRALNIKFMRDIPVVPLMYRPTQFHQFSEKHWRGFPAEENPIAPPQCLMIGAGVSGLWGLTPVPRGTPQRAN